MDLVRNSSLEQIQYSFSECIPDVLPQIGMNQQERPEPAGIPKVLCCASLNKVKISEEEGEDTRPMSVTKLAMQATQCPMNSIYTPSKHHASSYGSCLPLVSPKQNTMAVCLSGNPCESISVDIILPISQSLQKWLEASRTPPEVFWYVSFYKVMTNDDH